MKVVAVAFFLLLSGSTLATPTSVPCPSSPLVRHAQSLSSEERGYISERTRRVLPGQWETYVQNVKKATSAKLPRYISHVSRRSSRECLPRLGIAVSGGGYRAALFGAGALSSLDARNATAARKTGTGGLLQTASYVAGLSGGAWLVTALAQANFPTIPDLVFPPPQTSQSSRPDSVYGGFNAQLDLTNPSNDPNTTANYIKLLISEIVAKRQAGLPVTLADVWTRAISRHFVNGTTEQNILLPGSHGASVLFSDIPALPSFASHQQPFPLIVSDSFSPKPNTSEIVPGAIVPLTNEIWEFNVFETGSFDPTLSSFIQTKFLGSTNSNHCISGFDQAAFIAGTSSDVFPGFNVTEAAIDGSPVGPILAILRGLFPNEGVRLDSSAIPNPFQGINQGTFGNSNETIVSLADGGLDGEVLPLQPLLVREREVDTIIALDASGDRPDHFTDGTDMILAAKRASLFGKTYPFPQVPATTAIFASQNLTVRPSFFGCEDTSGAPLIIYIANGGPPANGEAPVTNTSTQQTTYSSQEVRAFIDQSFEIATQGAPVKNGDPKWGACLACAVFDRARKRTGERREGICETCFQQYCWHGM